VAIELTIEPEGRQAEVLSSEALAFVEQLETRFGPRRRELLDARAERRRRIAAGETLDFLEDTKEVREGDWTIDPVPQALQDRRTEITGPVDRKMMINALNSGATGFMADFEDSLSPTWSNVVDGQANCIDAIAKSISFEGEDGRTYELGDETAVLIPRPRGWHLPEKHFLLNGAPVAGAFVDFGLYVFHNGRELASSGQGPFFYLPKMESHLEARLWNDVFSWAEEEVGIDPGTIKGTVLIETLPAAFEMDEILYELRTHAAGLNAGRWDYIFSAIKYFRERPEYVLPDRSAVTMTVPFMRAYTELLVRTCHRREAHAMGGMAAQIPSRKDPEGAEKAKDAVRADKQREAGDGFDGTWVAHPDVVDVAKEQFDAVLGSDANQVAKKREDVSVGRDDLLDVGATPGEITEKGLRNDVNVGIQYISSWLRGNGAAGIYGMMEDAATAEISRSQIWQWIQHERATEDGEPITRERVQQLAEEELETIRSEIGDDEWFEREGRPKSSRELFEQVALADDFAEFLTLPAYERLEP
jgi:malate synthase